jgi:ligand-binding sensor domain-containing protein
MWAGTWGNGLLLQNGERFERAPGLEAITDPMPALYYPRPGGPLWIGSSSGLLRFENGASKLIASDFVAPDVRCIAQDPQGIIWFGMSGGGLGKLEGATAKQFLKADGLASEFLQCLLTDDDGSLWIGTADAGLNRLKNGKFSSVTTAHGLRNNVICHIADDGRGFFWISSHDGIMRVPKAELRPKASPASKVPAASNPPAAAPLTADFGSPPSKASPASIPRMFGQISSPPTSSSKNCA